MPTSGDAEGGSHFRQNADRPLQRTPSEPDPRLAQIRRALADARAEVAAGRQVDLAMLAHRIGLLCEEAAAGRGPDADALGRLLTEVEALQGGIVRALDRPIPGGG